VDRDNLKNQISEWVKEESKHTYRYYRSVLSKEGRECYDVYFHAFLSFQKTFLLPTSDPEICDKAYQYCLLDNPLLFYAGDVSLWRSTGGITVKVNYKVKEKELYEIWQETDRIIRLVRAKCNGKSDIKKEELIHNTMVRSVVYKDSDYMPVHSSYAAFMYRKAVCDGISKMSKILFDAVDLPSVIVFGTSWQSMNESGKHLNEGAHAWNMVKIGGNFYHVDVTFDLNLSNEHHIRYDYFNLTDEQISREHSYQIGIRTPKEEGDYYHTRGTYFNNKEKLRKYLVGEMDSGKTLIGFKLPYTANPEYTYQSISAIIKKALNNSKRHVSRYITMFNEDQMVLYIQLIYS